MKKILKKLLAPVIREVVQEEIKGLNKSLTIEHLIKEFSVVVRSCNEKNHSDKYPQYSLLDLKGEVVSVVIEALNKTYMFEENQQKGQE
ncbi:hypothetical protein CGC58_09535 [Capnocytophaga stomatis]|uniref:Uncharacterized protein n=1 Tax=Capnocytophaga stomatis TaxID=1848904 RepID=A0A250FXR8_9FLAO|nr:hypothetical protein CGC58_09535 [Capnocytophaga stomatis]